MCGYGWLVGWIDGWMDEIRYQVHVREIWDRRKRERSAMFFLLFFKSPISGT